MLSNKLKLNADKTHLLTLGTQQRLHTLPHQAEVNMERAHLEEDKDKCELLLGCSIQANLKWHAPATNLLSKLKTRLTGPKKIKFIVPFTPGKLSLTAFSTASWSTVSHYLVAVIIHKLKIYRTEQHEL